MKIFSQKLMAGTIAGFSTGVASSVASAQELDSIVKKTTGNLDNIPQLISAVLYIGGAVIAASGILSLKKHVDDPNSTPLKNGVARLVVGALLLVAPVAFKSILDTLGVQDSGGGVSYQGLDALGT